MTGPQPGSKCGWVKSTIHQQPCFLRPVPQKGNKSRNLEPTRKQEKGRCHMASAASLLRTWSLVSLDPTHPQPPALLLSALWSLQQVLGLRALVAQSPRSVQRLPVLHRTCAEECYVKMPMA